MPNPPNALPISGRRVEALLAVVNGARTVDEVRRLCRWGSTQSAWHALAHLRDLGFVAWETGQQGTLRPLVYEPLVLTILSVESETMTIHTPLVLARADIAGTDGTTYTGVAIRVLDGEAHVADRSGANLGTRTGVVSMISSPPGWAVQFENGSVWNVERGGCGCGGSV